MNMEFKMYRITKSAVFAIALTFFTVDASAISLSVRPSFNMGDRAGRSWDGPNYDIPSYFLPYTDGKVYSAGSFAGDNSTWNFQLVGETTAYQDINISAVNGSPSISLFTGADNVGASKNVTFSSANFFTGFSISDPSGTFYSNDASNPYNGQNLLAIRIDSRSHVAGDGLVSVPNPWNPPGGRYGTRGIESAWRAMPNPWNAIRQAGDAKPVTTLPSFCPIS